MERELVFSTQYKKDLKRLAKQKARLESLLEAVELLRTDAKLPRSYKDHGLEGNLKDYRELHAASDLLVVYRKVGASQLNLAAAGSHAELYGK